MDTRLRGHALMLAFSLAAVGAGAGRALTTTYLPVLLEDIKDAPTLIGAVMTVNALAGFAVPIAIGVWSDRRGRRLPFLVAGAGLTGGGLVAVGLGHGTSYLALALAAALVYEVSLACRPGEVSALWSRWPDDPPRRSSGVGALDRA